MGELYPGFDHEQALILAYNAADRSGDGWIGRRELRLLLHHLVYFTDLWGTFEELEADCGGRVSPKEFERGCRALGLRLSPRAAKEAFARADRDSGRAISDCHFRKTGIEYDRKHGIKWLSCTEKWQSDITPPRPRPARAVRRR